MALTVAAIVGAILAWRQLSPAALQARSASVQANLARRTHVTELFNRAAGQLRDPNLEVRLAAIYVLREIAKDFPDLSNPVFELLRAYLRAGNIDLRRRRTADRYQRDREAAPEQAGRIR